MKLNWGNSIALVFVLFMSFIIHFVIRAFNEDFDLVSESYYKDEINYQQRIDDRSNLLKSGQSVSISQSAETIAFSFPQEFKNAIGEIHFYHPSRTIFDRRFDISIEANGHQLIAKSDVVKGRYTLKLDWEADGMTFYQEADIYVR